MRIRTQILAITLILTLIETKACDCYPNSKPDWRPEDDKGWLCGENLEKGNNPNSNHHLKLKLTLITSLIGGLLLTYIWERETFPWLMNWEAHSPSP